uniref:Uncharacterized protein n=1 Tax=Mimivirus LCMiAC01 TaxID=2506608 RepID=A0A481YYU7_9VIRU|nr:MAG: uncharacterized protein LCMiAC01_01000 [Mimivirus LCMiAC01]
MSNIKKIFLSESTLKNHIDLQTSNYNEYIINLILLDKYDVKFTIVKKARILAASMTRNDNVLSAYLLFRNDYDLPAVVKTCEILDSRRYINSLEKKTDRIKNKKKLSKHKSIIENTKKLNEGLPVSLSKSKIKFITRHWINLITKEDIENQAIQYAPKLWKKLIDLFHLKPNNFKLEWFPSYIFGKDYPTYSKSYKCSNITKDNIIDIVNTYQPSYIYLKTNYKTLITDDILKIIYEYTPLEDVMKYWKDFSVDYYRKKTIDRLQTDEPFNIPYGELMKRILALKKRKENKELVDTLINISEQKLDEYIIEIEQPVVVFGDASGSMDIAIKTSTIIASILCKIANAKMHLFRSIDEPIDKPPKNVHDVIEMGMKCIAGGGTAPAASLYPYLERKEIVKTFIIVTDEEENVNYKEQSFSSIFKQYWETIYQSKLIFVSFVSDNKDGYMVSDLKKEIPGVEKNIIQFRLNYSKPDLRKLDTLLNTMEMESDAYNKIFNFLFEKIKNMNYNKINNCIHLINKYIGNNDSEQNNNDSEQNNNDSEQKVYRVSI